MPFEIVRNDITRMAVDAIVNTANPSPLIGPGVDAQIHAAAGPELLNARQEIGYIRVGDAFVTPGFRLNAKYVIHTSGPLWQGGNQQEDMLLASCYSRSLFLAWQYRCESVAFPLISSGNYGFPKGRALKIAVETIRSFLSEHELQVFLVVYDQEAVRLSEERYQDVFRYLSENYTLFREPLPPSVGMSQPLSAAMAPAEREAAPKAARRSLLGRPFSGKNRPQVSAPPPAAMPVQENRRDAEHTDFSLDTSGWDFPRFEPDAGFSETLLKLIDETGKKDSEIYTRANVSRQHFSKIRNNPNYKPTKATAIAFAIALELDMAQTRDLIGRAGFALTRSSKFDLIIMYFINNKCYDLYEINAMLFEFDQSLLGA